MPRQLTTSRRFLIRPWRFRLHEWTVLPFTPRGFQGPTSSRRVEDPARRIRPTGVIDNRSVVQKRRDSGRDRSREQAAQRDELLAETADEISRSGRRQQRRSATAAKRSPIEQAAQAAAQIAAENCGARRLLA